MKKIYLLPLSVLAGILVSFSPAEAQTWWPQTSNTNNKLRDINFFDNYYGFAFGDTLATALKTTNQGAAWSSLNPAFSRAELFSSAFLGLNSVVAVGVHDVTGGNGVVMRTTNAGSTWTADTTLPEKLFDVSFVNSTTGWISGENGYIAKTTNGGSTWSALNTGTGEDIFSLHFTSVNRGWAVGTVATNAVILHTADGGATWAMQTSGLVDQLHSVFFIDSLKGWAVGAGGNIIATTDGGASWVSQTSGVTNDLFDVDFLDANNGWAVGGNGTILKTTNGGSTWTTETSGTTADLLAVDMRSASLGWVSGDGGTIRVYGPNAPSSVAEAGKATAEVSVYPNPAADEVSIQYNGSENHWNLQVFDINGRLILGKDKINEQITTLDKSKLQSGVYYIRVSDAKGVAATSKVVVL